MKSLATTALAGLMVLGAISGIAASKNSNQVVAFSDGGPAPLCLPSTPNCPSPIPQAAVQAKFSDGGPAPLCLPSTPNCPSPIPQVVAKVNFSDGGPAPLCLPSTPNCPSPIPQVREAARK